MIFTFFKKNYFNKINNQDINKNTGNNGNNVKVNMSNESSKENLPNNLNLVNNWELKKK